jgi:periplasmic protein CpxP/Spy
MFQMMWASMAAERWNCHDRSTSVLQHRPEHHSMRLPTMSRGAVLAIGAGLAAAMLLSIAGASRAALTEGGLSRAGGSRPLLLVQAPAPPAPNVDANIATLRQRLAITPAQEPQFNALANVMRENARMMPAAPPSTALNAVEGLRLAIRYGQQEIDGMRRMLPALQALYATLSPAQRAAADQIFRQGPGQ